jgi:hypothetical protein
MEVYNYVLRSLGYPEFHDCEDTYLTSKPFASQNGYIRDGLQITRVDLTLNYMSDIPALDMLRYLSTNTYRGEAGFLYPNGRTVEWLGTRSGDNGKTSTHIYYKYYDKAWDIEQKLKKCVQLRKRHLVNSQKLDHTIFNSQLLVITETINYLTRLLDYCNMYNVVRFELELKSKKIKELGLSKLGRWSREIMLELVNKYTPHTKTKCQFNKTVDLYSQLLLSGLKPSSASSYSVIGQLWLNGHDVNYQRNISIKKNTYYRARSALLLLGFDIASPLNIVNFPVHVQTVMLKPLEKPSWYREAA